MRIVKTKTSDSLVLNGLLSEPFLFKNKIIIHVHGMAGSIVLEDFYQSMHEQYTKKGIAFLAGENRGLGVLTPFYNPKTKNLRMKGSALEKFEDCRKDIAAWIRVAEKLGYKEIWLQGHSLGCSKIAYYLDKSTKNKIRGVIFISPAGMLGLSKIWKGQELVNKAGKFIREGKKWELIKTKFLRSGLLSANTIVNMFGKKSKMDIFQFASKSFDWTVVNKIHVPVLAITGTEDKGITLLEDPYEAMEKLSSELKHSPRVKTVVLKNAGHLFAGFAQQIVDEVLGFIR